MAMPENVCSASGKFQLELEILHEDEYRSNRRQGLYAIINGNFAF